MHQIMQFESVRSCAAIARRVGLSDGTNSEARSRGKGGTTCTAQATTHSADVTQNPSQSVSLTRRKFRAPQL